jgi:alkanesulfonate monooxygenase SsuD/methylene tetrahydromethanopterin reductase-like flavin-dependent oxidoreductase (luciferase family)
MRLGFALPQIGPAAGPNALVAVAKRAEELGYAAAFVDGDISMLGGSTNLGVWATTSRP